MMPPWPLNDPVVIPALIILVVAAWMAIEAAIKRAIAHVRAVMKCLDEWLEGRER